MKTLIIAEKPSVAADLAKALGKIPKKGDFFEDDKLVIASALGHLVELFMPQDIDPKLKSWRAQYLPIIPEKFGLKPIDKVKKKFDELKKLMKREDVEAVVNGCDAGREGELIFSYLYELSGCKKPVSRLWMQSMTGEAIRQAYAHLKSREDMRPLEDAARCRSESDWLVGINGTRAVTGKLFAGRMGQVATVGRVQTPTLTLVLERQQAIDAFKPKDYWRIVGKFGIHNGEYEGLYQRPDFKKGLSEHDRIDRIWEEAHALRLVEDLGKIPQALVTEEKKRSKQSPARLFNLTALQREANSRFGFPAGMTLKTAQSLYEKHKAITYPRTDAKALPQDYEANCLGVLQSFKGSAYEGHAQRVLKNNWVNPQNRSIFNNAEVSDHFAIIPTEEVPSKLSEVEEKIYDLITRRFLAVFHPAAEFDVTTRLSAVGPHVFKTEGKVMVVPGWTLVYEREQDKEALPALDPQDGTPPKAQVLGLENQKDVTRPPPRYTEATLLAAMEGAGKLVEDEDFAQAMRGKGLGTPATRAQIIDHLIAEKYMAREGRDLLPTPKAEQLVTFLKAIQAESLTSPTLTGEWEHRLHQIETGALSRKAFMEAISEMTQKLVRQALGFNEKESAMGPSGLISPSDGRPMLETLTAYRSEDNGFTLYKVIGGRKFSEAELATLIKDKKIGPLDDFRSKAGKPFCALLQLDENGKVKFVFDAADGSEAQGAQDLSTFPVVGTCPKDHAPVYETPNAYICANQPEKKCDFRVAHKLLECPLSTEQFQKLLTEKKTDLLDKFRSKRTKRLFSAHLILNPDGTIGFEFPPRAGRGGERGTP